MGEEEKKTKTMVDYKAQVDKVVGKYKDMAQNLKKDPMNPKPEDLRLISATVLVLQTAVSLVLPSLIRGLTGGFGITSDYQCNKRVDEHVRATGVLALGLVLVNYMSQQWNDEAKSDVAKIMTITFAFGAFVTLLTLYNGGSIIYVLVLLLQAALTFFHAKETGLWKKNQ